LRSFICYTFHKKWQSLKKYFLISAVLLFTILPLNAQEIYIKVMSARYKDTLFDITAKFHLMGYKMHLFEYQEWHRVYTGPFHNMDDAHNALNIIRKNGANDAYIVNNNIDEKSSYPIYLQDAYIVKNFQHKKVDEFQENQKHSNTSEKVLTADKIESMPTEITPAAVIVPTVPLTNNTIPKVQNNDKKVQEKRSFKENYFIGLSVGFSSLDVEEKDVTGNLNLDSTLDESGMTYGINTGYYFNESIFITLNYQYTPLDDVYFNDIFGTFNYRFKEILSFYPYVGAIIGYSQMTWDKDPLNSSNNSNNSSSYLGGIQIGAEKHIMDQLALYISYQYLMMEHTTKIKTFLEEKELEHTSKQNLNIGIKYFF